MMHKINMMTQSKLQLMHKEIMIHNQEEDLMN